MMSRRESEKVPVKYGRGMREGEEGDADRNEEKRSSGTKA